MSPTEQYEMVESAVSAGLRSPCKKSRRGVVIWNREGIVATGWNHQPHPFACDGTEECRTRCSRVCVHAEAHALLRAGDRARGAHMLHVEVGDADAAVEGGPPSCWQCSRMILAADIAVMWLLEAGRGWIPYTAVDFHRITLENMGMR